eukprot:364582-Chlamydomonas_euryale.AAC.6
MQRPRKYHFDNRRLASTHGCHTMLSGVTCTGHGERRRALLTKPFKKNTARGAYKRVVLDFVGALDTLEMAKSANVTFSHCFAVTNVTRLRRRCRPDALPPWQHHSVEVGLAIPLPRSAAGRRGQDRVSREVERYSLHPMTSFVNSDTLRSQPCLAGLVLFAPLGVCNVHEQQTTFTCGVWRHSTPVTIATVDIDRLYYFNNDNVVIAKCIFVDIVRSLSQSLPGSFALNITAYNMLFPLESTNSDIRLSSIESILITPAHNYEFILRCSIQH